MCANNETMNFELPVPKASTGTAAANGFQVPRAGLGGTLTIYAASKSESLTQVPTLFTQPPN